MRIDSLAGAGRSAVAVHCRALGSPRDADDLEARCSAERRPGRRNGRRSAGSRAPSRRFRATGRAHACRRRNLPSPAAAGRVPRRLGRNTTNRLPAAGTRRGKASKDCPSNSSTAGCCRFSSAGLYRASPGASGRASEGKRPRLGQSSTRPFASVTRNGSSAVSRIKQAIVQAVIPWARRRACMPAGPRAVFAGDPRIPGDACPTTFPRRRREGSSCRAIEGWAATRSR